MMSGTTTYSSSVYSSSQNHNQMNTNTNTNTNTNNFSEEQQDVYDAYLEGKNIFLTGPGGCGKSYVIKQIVNHARTNNKKIEVCAMTGCASVLLNCGAKTLHSWAGIGLAKGPEEPIITRIMLSKYKKMNWTRTQVLIIDEVSMMSKKLFNLLDQIGKRIRRNAKPFGGIQVIFSGDFYQLPPIGDINDPDSSLFCFESEHWDETFDYQIILDKVFRQKDEMFIEVLRQVREGKLYKNAYNTLSALVNKPFDDALNETGIKPVVLLPTKSAVDRINYESLNNIQADETIFKYKVGYAPVPEYVLNPRYKKPTQKEFEFEEKNLLMNSMFEPELPLKIGSQVMCIANLDVEGGICNGSTGKVIKFENGVPYVKFYNGRTLAMTPHNWMSENINGFYVSQVPLIMAWAVTIHKSQGATMDCAEIDIGSSIFAAGQTYVALSRVRSLEGLYLKAFNPNKIKTNKKVLEFYERFYQEDDDCVVVSEEQPQQITMSIDDVQNGNIDDIVALNDENPE
jgi:ATP-dependent DNA helicase PIF1